MQKKVVRKPPPEPSAAATIEQPAPAVTSKSRRVAREFDGNSLGAFVAMTPLPIRVDLQARDDARAVPVFTNAGNHSRAISAYQAALDGILGIAALILEQQARGESTGEAFDALKSAISAAAALRGPAEIAANRSRHQASASA